MEDILNDSIIYDDDHYINDCSSYKRKLTIIEKVFIIISRRSSYIFKFKWNC